MVSITATTNFNATTKPITIVTATTFTYRLGTVGNTTPEIAGTVTSQGEKLLNYQNTTPEASILDQVGKWEFAGRVVLTNSDGFPTSSRFVFWVS